MNDNREWATGNLWEEDWKLMKERPIGGDKPHLNVHPVIITHVWIRTS